MCICSGLFLLRNIWELQQKLFALHVPRCFLGDTFEKPNKPTLDDFCACRLLSYQLDVGLLLSCHYGHCCHGGETKQQGVSLCFLGHRPPMSDHICNSQGGAVYITTHSLHKPACEQTEVKSMNITSLLFTVWTAVWSTAPHTQTASRWDHDFWLHCIFNCCMWNKCDWKYCASCCWSM